MGKQSVHVYQPNTGVREPLVKDLHGALPKTLRNASRNNKAATCLSKEMVSKRPPLGRALLSLCKRSKIWKMSAPNTTSSRPRGPLAPTWNAGLVVGVLLGCRLVQKALIDPTQLHL